MSQTEPQLESEPNHVTEPLAGGEVLEGRAPELRLAVWKALLWAVGAVVAFHIAYLTPSLGILILVFFFALGELTRLESERVTLLIGLGVGLGVAGPKLAFFWNIFGPAAIVLWLILAFWVAMFLVLARGARRRFGGVLGTLLIPFLWTGLEYFRSELYYLRFSWLNAGYALGGGPAAILLKGWGMYGAGFLAMSVGLGLWVARSRLPVLVSGCILLVGLWCWWPPKAAIALSPVEPAGTSVRVAGIQLENSLETVAGLESLVKRHPEAELVVLSEYTLTGPVPDEIRAWCRKHRKYLIIGGEDPVVAGAAYRNTAFVIGPAGEDVFRQAKSVPIQFFKDGMPAEKQALWESPWGKIGICICYDLSYRRVTDRLAKMGAQAIIVPTMDVAAWGKRQHQLHSLVAPVRAAEYGVPIFRLASSGISQVVDGAGNVLVSAGFPGEGDMVAGTIYLGTPARVPLDWWLGPLSTGVAAVTCGLLLLPWRQRRQAAA